MKHSNMGLARSHATSSQSGVRTAATSLLLIFWILVAAYYLNNPTPDGIRDPWKYKGFVAAKRIAIDAAYVLSLFTSSHYVQLFRSFVESAAFVVASPPEVRGSNIRYTLTTFEGVKVRLYEPIKRRADFGPAVVFIHGGAFVIGSTAMFDFLTRRFAEELDCVLVSIEYRLAPEHPFPAAYEDCLNATKWFMDHAQEFNVDSSRIGIAGDSAGGALAAAVAQILHDEPGYPDVAFQALIYPITQFIDNHTPATFLSISLFGEEGSMVTWQEAGEFTCFYLLGRLDERVVRALVDNTHTSVEFRRESPLAQFVNHTMLPLHMQDYGHLTPPHLQEQRGDDYVWDQIDDIVLDPRASPLLRREMAGLPPTFVVTCEFDALRDHGAFYAIRLQEAGVPVRWEHYQGGFHGVLGPTWPLVFEVGENMFRDLILYAKEHLAIEAN
ncbi:arylacetamide deacetylase-like [Acanthaster planci]|uniref:Arylacetamide deacetylase-like n=1 Tax=Acanthaster planci TaxID=133434 RepID=A0A8B7ZB66_ACAPL|nr:arylacetamide deacetylase-like [Acanthaster planci]